MLIRFLSSLLLAASLVAAPAADFKVQKGVAAPDGIPAALKGAVQAEGVRVLNDSGAPYAEIWLNKALNAEAKAPATDIFYTGIPEGSFLGVWRFVTAGSDFRGQQVKPGFYSMRYGLMPADGNHMGASQFRDFVLLVPAEADTNPDAALKFDQIVSLSRKASGTGHPAVFPLVNAARAAEPTFVIKTDQGSWILNTRIPTKSGEPLLVAITVLGRAEQ